jgi:DNA-directed RNA polymerase subunit N (RpoN/RPB10)
MYIQFCGDCFNFIGDMLVPFKQRLSKIRAKYNNFNNSVQQGQLEGEISELFLEFHIPEHKFCCRNYLVNYTNLNEIIGIDTY